METLNLPLEIGCRRCSLHIIIRMSGRIEIGEFFTVTGARCFGRLVSRLTMVATIWAL